MTAAVKTPRANRRPARQPTDVDRVVGLKIREARKSLGLTQDQLAREVGLTFQQIQKYEKAVNRVSAGLLYEFSIVLDQPITFFFGLDDESSAE